MLLAGIWPHPPTLNFEVTFWPVKQFLVDVLSHDCAPGSPSPVEHVDGVKAIAELLRVALDESRLFAVEVAASVSCLGVHEVDEREICRGQSGGARAMCVLRPTHL